MPLSIRNVRSLDDVIAPAKDFLCRSVDFFARQRIVVPTAGAKAWLAAKLAEQLGASLGADGKPMGDGIVANVEFSYPGTISSLLSDAPRPEIDPWDVDRLTFTILEVLDENKEAFKSVVVRAGGPLLAARRIADRFDHYHFRRAAMILQWEAGRPTLSPSADADGVEKTPAITDADRWQFNLWRAVRDKIGEPSPPAREREANGPAPDAVMVAGLQGLSLRQIAILERLASMPSASGRSCDVQVWLVHPSPPLREKWAEAPDAPPRSLGLAPFREEPEASHEVDPLVDSWLRGTREMQWLLRSQGHEPVHATSSVAELPAADTTLLERLQHTVACGHVATPADSEIAPDDSIRIHRCHDLGRQAEVLHDAILHAFREVEGLAPHDVVIVSPQIAKLAPHLEAVFDRHVHGKTADGVPTAIDLPLIVADRGIREVSRGAELLAAIIELVGSRYSVDDMLRVAAHPLVLEHFGLGEDDVEDWYRCIERTKIRWGLDGPRRTSLDRSDLMAHTWRLGLERALLGAVIPDGIPEPVLGGVVPLAHVEPAELTSLAPLISIFTIIDDLDRQAREPHPVGAWCDILESAIETLVGEENDELLVPTRELSEVRQAAATAKTKSPEAVCVPFHDVKTILAGKLTAPVGRQPLRTGAITATSMIPLRSVPFRVVCVAGFDDDAVAPRERDGEDLVDRQDLLGDGDPRLEVRRGLLDCVLSAQDRLIITCTGMDVKNNATLPLATPLAELTDFVDRHGVKRFPREGEIPCGIEVFHPRHACSRKNFVAGDAGVVPGAAAWSHDAAALAAAAGLGQELVYKSTDGAAVSGAGIAVPTHIDLKELAEFMHDPLWPYVTKTLEIKRWRDTDLSTPATIPLELEKLERRNLRDDYIKDLLAADNPGDFTKTWVNAVKVNADVPILGFGDDTVAEITLFTKALFELAREKKVPLGAGREIRIDLTLGDVHLSGKIDDWYPDEGAIVLVRPDAKSSKDFHKPRMLAAVLLLAARAEGHEATDVIEFNQHEKWPLMPDHNPVQARMVKAPDGLTPEIARTLLARLCGLYQQAAIRPYGCFGDASPLLDEPESARKKFQDFVSNDRYSMSNESLVYGPQPDFDLVFPDDESVRGFFQSLQGLTTFTRSHAYIPT